MSIYNGEEKIIFETVDMKKEILSDLSSRINKGGEPPTSHTSMEAEKRIRREIANSNERRRMQSINNGFQSLRSLLPHHEGEKLSKAAILQQTAEYIYNLEQEKTQLLSQNCQLKRLVNQHEGGELPPKKRKTNAVVTNATTEVVLPPLDDDNNISEAVSLIAVTVNGPVAGTNTTNENTAEIKRQLEKERNLRAMLEKQLQQMEVQMYELQQQMVQTQVHYVDDNEELALQLVAPESLPPIGHTQTIVCSPVRSRTVSPEPEIFVETEQRIPSVLEAAIKAEPKVEVERLPSPHATITSRSRQNLETIVEAIRHLEGDHMFGDEPQQRPQEAPLALITRPQNTNTAKTTATFIKFHATGGSGSSNSKNNSSTTTTTTTATLLQQQQSRPGVIVVKQAS